MRYFKQAIILIPLLLATHSYADEFISIPSTLFYNKIRFGMTSDMFGKMLGNKKTKIACRDLPRDDAYFKVGLDQKLCVQNVYDENGNNILHNLYFTNNRLTDLVSIFKPVDSNVDYHTYFDKNVDSLRKVVNQANVKCSKLNNDSRRCSFDSYIASIDFIEENYGTIIHVRPPNLLAEEYQRKATNGPMDVSLYGLEVGKSTLEELNKSARNNNWKVTKKEELFSYNKTDKTTYIIKPQDPTDVFVLTADFYEGTLSEFAYWFIDPFKTGEMPVKVGTNYLNLLINKYGKPYEKPSDAYLVTTWRVNKGYANEVKIRTNQSAENKLTYIIYTDASLEVRSAIKDINKSIDDHLKRFYGSKIEL